MSEAYGNPDKAEQVHSLGDLVGVSESEFKEKYWPRNPYIGYCSIELLESLNSLEGIDEDLGILDGYKGQVSALKPGGEAKEIKPGASIVDAYNDGYTCYLRGIEQYVPAIGRLTTTVAGSLGVEPKNFTCELFCSKGDSGVAMHSDYDVNIALLLRGAKSWKISRNTRLKNQPGVCLAGEFQPHPLVRELSKGIQMPKKMPADSIDARLSAGNTLFLPRGWWHETRATGECLQLNFVMKGPQLSEIATRAITQTLQYKEDWRDFAYGLATDNPSDVKQQLAKLISEAREDLSKFSDEEIADQIISTYKNDLENN